MADLSKNQEARISEAIVLSGSQLALERVITKVFNHYAIPLDISDAIRATFRSKLWRMGNTLLKFGGPRRSQEIDKWADPGSIWSLTVNSNEVCRQLLKRKCDVEKSSVVK